MHSLIYLKAAYAAAWLAYLGYLVRILLGMKKVKEETQELERTTALNDPTLATFKRSAS